MKNVVLIGANGATMQVLEDQLKDNPEVHLTLFLRNASRANTADFSVPVSVFEGDATNQEDLNNAIAGQDIVIVGLGGALAPFVEPIKQAMDKNNVSRLIFILGLGIYDEVPGKFGEWNGSFDGMPDFKHAAQLIENSGLNYTILRPAWMSNRPEVNYETTVKGETFRGTVITRASIADYIIKLINDPKLANQGSIGLSEPGTDGDSPYPFI
ncbi:NAD(P)H-binding protein [Lentilactobacillus kosonis]|uniref:Oxidoreductase n=1 Tax=Lentilactobacillus kosonis TaxID=2810561 RepID=A0A401FNW0_9LACO|nr:NAD(P)H-binding protein [Lentilactobacillus kosonis]GAY74027.1 oxidoreductase [Lentilactobacillus kosonis]